MIILVTKSCLKKYASFSLFIISLTKNPTCTAGVSFTSKTNYALTFNLLTNIADQSAMCIYLSHICRKLNIFTSSYCDGIPQNPRRGVEKC